MDKQQYTVEYLFNKASLSILWRSVSTPDGLSGWFADNVDRNGKIFTFFWDSFSQEAQVLRSTEEESIRFRWVDEPADTFFEFAIHKVELTGDLALTITDFADEGEEEDAIRLWNAQIDDLRRKTGM